MTRFLAGVLSVIAVGVLLIAYGLLSPRASAFDSRFNQWGQPMLVGDRFVPGDPRFAMPQGAANGNVQTAVPGPYGYGSYAPYGNNPYAPSSGQVMAVPANYVQPVTTTVAPAPRRVARTIERSPRRDWKKTALVIGGSSAAGAGVGGIIGGKKGALIGAAIGGGASTLYEVTKH